MTKQMVAKNSQSASSAVLGNAGSHKPVAVTPVRATSNQSMQRMLRAGAVQAKLTVNTPGDKYEQEADRVADQVMRMTSAAAGDPPYIQRACTSGNREMESQTLQRTCASCSRELESGHIQRTCASCSAELESEKTQRMCAGCETEELQRKDRGGAQNLSADVESQVLALQGSGEQLSPQVREFFEPRFGQDFSRVRVHTGGAASESATSVNALAYTLRNHIVFAAGQYSPHTTAGRRLIAHELTHTVQQSAGHTGTIQRACGSSVPTHACTPGSRTFVSGLGSFTFDTNCDTFKGGQTAALRTAVAAQPVTSTFEVHGFASVDAPALDAFNEKLACARAITARDFMTAPSPGGLGLGARITGVVGHGPTPGPALDRQVVVLVATTVAPPPPPPPPPVCPAVPTTTPGTCPTRNSAYCAAATCFPTNSWLPCVCTASGQVCDAVEAFSFRGTQGTLLGGCVDVFGSGRAPVTAKATWFLTRNACIWGHWRAAFEAIHNPAAPVPSSLTPEWAAAVTTCRASGISSRACCRAHVTAEQTAIDRCGPYSSATFGPLPTDVPGASRCSDVVLEAARLLGPPAPFEASDGDFGNVVDRIAYGNARCCP